MLRVGLTGGIGSGKTTVTDIFKVLGVPVFDADTAAKRIMEEDEALIASIKKEFGDAAYNDHTLNRKYLADIVFNNSYRLEKLNALIHPVTIQAAHDWMMQQNTPYVIKEAALMFESAAAAGVDVIVGVFAPKNLRIKRVMNRDGMKREDILARMDKQIDEEIKMKLCDFIIVNDEQQLVIPQVLQLHEKLLQLAASSDR
jgi:dephospho-CoA kinase